MPICWLLDHSFALAEKIQESLRISPWVSPQETQLCHQEKRVSLTFILFLEKQQHFA